MSDNDRSGSPPADANVTLATRPVKRGRSVRPEAVSADAAESSGRPDAGESGSRSAHSSDLPPVSIHGTSGHATSGASSQASRTTPSPTQQNEVAIARALLGDELTRAHGFSGVIALISAGVLGSLPLLEGEALAKKLCAAALFVISLASAATWRSTRPGVSYRRPLLRLYGLTISTGVLFVQYYIGMFSPAPVVVTLGVYYFAQSTDSVQARLIPLWVCFSYVVASLLVTLRIVPDVGLLDATDAALSSHLFLIVAVTIVLALTAWMAKLSRESMRAAILRSHEAMLVARKGEALLAEAQQQLERAIGIVVGKPSHYTGQTAGAFRLGVVIGSGAMGEVYEAQHVETGKPAAVKLLRPSSLARPDLVERFLREGEICASLKHPALVEVYEVGRMPNGAPFMAMERLYGSDLATRLRKEGQLQLSEVLELADSISAALTHVHLAGVVHRDLKPVNVFQTNSPEGGTWWKVLDFGISKQRESSGTLTDVGVVGTPGYMSPEQARGKPVDHRSDIFAMAAVLYRSLTGRPAFTGTDTPQIMFDVVYKMPERPSSTIKHVPSELDLVFAIALAKDPRQRWASAREFSNALRLAAAREISSEHRSRAQALLKAQPWGQSVEQPKAASSGGAPS